MTMASKQVYLLLIGISVLQTKTAADCPKGFVDSMPADHLFTKKPKPVVIGHRGNPMRFQENTLEGFQSLPAIGADGFELDIYLTKDEKLVVYHDDTTEVSILFSVSIVFKVFEIPG